MKLSKKRFSRTRHRYSLFSPKLLIIGILMIMALGCVLAGQFYVNHFLTQWSEEHKVAFQAEKWTLGWGTSPRLILKNVDCRHHIQSASLQKLHVDELALELKLWTLLKSYFKVGDILVEAQGIKIDAENKSYAAIKRASFHGILTSSTYKMIDLETSAIHIGLSPLYTTSPDNDEPQSFLSHLSFPPLAGALEFHEIQKVLKMDVRTASSQWAQHQNTPYDIKTQGTLHFLEGHFPTPPHQIPLPLKGQLTFTVNHFSHLLNHLRKARLISTILENLGTILGYPVSKEDILSGDEEIFTNAVTLHFILNLKALTWEGLKFILRLVRDGSKN